MVDVTRSVLQKKIIGLLKDNNGEIEEEKVCTLLGIARHQIPWGHDIGWAMCLQIDQKYHLILSSSYKPVNLPTPPISQDRAGP